MEDAIKRHKSHKGLSEGKSFRSTLLQFVILVRPIVDWGLDLDSESESESGSVHRVSGLALVWEALEVSGCRLELDSDWGSDSGPGLDWAAELVMESEPASGFQPTLRSAAP